MVRKARLFHFFVLIALLFNACSLFPEEKKEVNKEVNAEDYAFYKAINSGRLEEVEALLKAGHDPNYMNRPGADEWFDTNPLWNLNPNDGGFEVMKLLIRYGANAGNRGYIARILDGGHFLSQQFTEETRPYYHGWPEVSLLPESRAYQITELFLENGGKPNLKSQQGFGPVWLKVNPRNDETMQAYFQVHGITALNVAIRKNLFTVLDLLLDNGAVLDGDSLAYAREATVNCGGNPMMENKIRALLP